MHDLSLIHTIPTCLSMLKILLFAPNSYSLEVTSFSTANTTPSFPLNATAVLYNMKKLMNNIIKPSLEII